MQCGRGRLPEQRFVDCGKSPKFPKSAARCDFGDGCRMSIGSKQRTSRQMQPSQRQKALRRHPKLLLTKRAQRPLGNTDQPTQVRDKQRDVNVGLDGCFELLREERAPAKRNTFFACLSVQEAHDHRSQVRALQRVGGFRRC